MTLFFAHDLAVPAGARVEDLRATTPLIDAIHAFTERHDGTRPAHASEALIDEDGSGPG